MSRLINKLIIATDLQLRMLYPLVGKFMNQYDFDIVDADLKQRYRGRVFFFETCIIYTEAIERGKLQFRGYYMYTDIGIAYDEGKNKFFLYQTERGIKEIECVSKLNEIPYWTESLHLIMNTVDCKCGKYIFRKKLLILVMFISSEKKSWNG